MGKTSILALAALTALAGCASVSPAERRAADEGQCRSYGFRPGTEAFAACLQRIDLARAADRRAFLNSDPFPNRTTIVYRPIVVR